jgi:hypothetical protein
MSRSILSAAFLAVSAPALAGTFAAVSVPSLDDVGLVALTLVVAVAGGIAARRKRK